MKARASPWSLTMSSSKLYVAVRMYVGSNVSMRSISCHARDAFSDWSLFGELCILQALLQFVISTLSGDRSHPSNTSVCSVTSSTITSCIMTSAACLLWLWRDMHTLWRVCAQLTEWSFWNQRGSKTYVLTPPVLYDFYRTVPEY